MSWSLRTTTRVCNALGVHSDILSSLGIAVSYLHGFLDCLAYCHTSRVLIVWKKYFLTSLRHQSGSDDFHGGSDVGGGSGSSSNLNGSGNVKSSELTSVNTKYSTSSDSENFRGSEYATNVMHMDSSDSDGTRVSAIFKPRPH
jgi:hypothetical protein